MQIQKITTLILIGSPVSANDYNWAVKTIVTTEGIITAIIDQMPTLFEYLVSQS